MKTLSPILIAALGAIVFQTPTLPADAAGRRDTSRSMMALSPKAADAKVKQDLLSILQPAGKFVRGMHAHVVMKTLRTRPYGAGFKGLCRMDELSVHYATTAQGREAIDEPLRPYGLEAKPMFHVTRGSISNYTVEESRPGAWADDCKKLPSNTSDAWFTAPTELEAARGVNLFLAAMTSLRSGELKVKDCDLGLKGKTCGEEILQLGQVSKIMAVDKDCAALAASAGPLSECFDIRTTESVELTIVASFAKDGVEPERVQSISASQFIVVT